MAQLGRGLVLRWSSNDAMIQFFSSNPHVSHAYFEFEWLRNVRLKSGIYGGVEGSSAIPPQRTIQIQNKMPKS